MSDQPAWKLDGFRKKLDEWRDRENPADDLYEIARRWVDAREHGNPVQGARRRPQEPLFTADENGVEDGVYWRALVTSVENGSLMCDFQVFRDGRVICEDFGTI